MQHFYYILAKCLVSSGLAMSNSVSCRLPFVGKLEHMQLVRKPIAEIKTTKTYSIQ